MIICKNTDKNDLNLTTMIKLMNSLFKKKEIISILNMIF